jgi:hypothetical protein
MSVTLWRSLSLRSIASDSLIAPAFAFREELFAVEFQVSATHGANPDHASLRLEAAASSRCMSAFQADTGPAAKKQSYA